MIILLLLGQSLNEQRLIRIEDRINALETDDTNKRLDDLRNDLRNQMIFFGTLFVGILGVLITFLISKQTKNWLLNLKKNLRI